ncbi:MAG TPA: Pvc16 family protein [Bryobacteraceae bacterium]|nr:Pvc16 family protein [Bryobacteraceae bacterium]
MSYAAINSVTQGLRMLLYSQLVRFSSNAVVTLLPPGDELPDVSGVNFYLYRVLESPFTKNRPWPGDRATPPSKKPPLGLQLFYLLTPLGATPSESTESAGDYAHTMLGIAMSTFHENAILNDVYLPALPASGTLNATPGFDADAVLPDDLRNSYEQIKITLLPTTLDELSKIWATINQPYRLSVAYEVSLVEIVPTAAPPVSGSTVAPGGIGLTVFPITVPTIDALSPASGSLAALSGGVVTPLLLTIEGRGFQFPGRMPVVEVGGQTALLRPGSPPSALTVALPVDLDAGPEADVVVTLNGKSSAAAQFDVIPWLSRVVPMRSGDPGSQKITLTGGGFTTNPQGVLFQGTGAPPGVMAMDPGSTDTSGSLTIPAGLANGIYSLRMVLNDAQHSVTNSRTLEIIPRIDTAVLTPGSPPAANLAIGGARLNGSDIRIVVDDVEHVAAPNSNAASLNYTFARPLAPGSHTLSVSIDGQASHTLDLEA